MSGTRFLCKKPVPEPSGKNSNIFNGQPGMCRLSCASAQISHFSRSPETPIRLRRIPGLATGSLTRTRAKEEYLGVFAGGPGGGFLARKSPPDFPMSKIKNP